MVEVHAWKENDELVAAVRKWCTRTKELLNEKSGSHTEESKTNRKPTNDIETLLVDCLTDILVGVAHGKERIRSLSFVGLLDLATKISNLNKKANNDDNSSRPDDETDLYLSYDIKNVIGDCASVSSSEILENIYRSLGICQVMETIWATLLDKIGVLSPIILRIAEDMMARPNTAQRDVGILTCANVLLSQYRSRKSTLKSGPEKERKDETESAGILWSMYFTLDPNSLSSTTQSLIPVMHALERLVPIFVSSDRQFTLQLLHKLSQTSVSEAEMPYLCRCIREIVNGIVNAWDPTSFSLFPIVLSVVHNVDEPGIKSKPPTDTRVFEAILYPYIKFMAGHHRSEKKGNQGSTDNNRKPLVSQKPTKTQDSYKNAPSNGSMTMPMSIAGIGSMHVTDVPAFLDALLHATVSPTQSVRYSALSCIHIITECDAMRRSRIGIIFPYLTRLYMDKGIEVSLLARQTTFMAMRQIQNQEFDLIMDGSSTSASIVFANVDVDRKTNGDMCEAVAEWSRKENIKQVAESALTVCNHILQGIPYMSIDSQTSYFRVVIAWAPSFLGTQNTNLSHSQPVLHSPFFHQLLSLLDSSQTHLHAPVANIIRCMGSSVGMLPMSVLRQIDHRYRILLSNADKNIVISALQAIGAFPYKDLSQSVVLEVVPHLLKTLTRDVSVRRALFQMLSSSKQKPTKSKR